MKPRDVIKILKDDGWYVREQKGSHIQLVHKIKKGRVTIPNHNTDLKPGTLNSILKQAGLK